MTSDGSPWRPITHIEDICEAMLCALQAPRDAVAGEAFNVGADTENYRIREIAEIVAATFPGCELTVGEQCGDTAATGSPSPRNSATHAGEFRTSWTPSAARGSWRACSSASGSPRDVEAPPFTRLRERQHLRDTGQIDATLFWTAPNGRNRPGRAPGRSRLEEADAHAPVQRSGPRPAGGGVAAPGRAQGRAARTYPGQVWRALKAKRKEAALRLAPQIARRARRAARTPRAAARSGRNPARPRRVAARALGPRRGHPHRPDREPAAAALRGASRPATSAPPSCCAAARRDRRCRSPSPPPTPVDLPAETAAGLVVYTTRFARGRVPPARADRGRAVRTSASADHDDPVEGSEIDAASPRRGHRPGAGRRSGPGIPAMIGPRRGGEDAEASLSFAPDVLWAGNFDTFVTRPLAAPQDFAAWRIRAPWLADLRRSRCADALPRKRRAAALDQRARPRRRMCRRGGRRRQPSLLWRRHKTTAAAGAGRGLVAASRGIRRRRSRARPRARRARRRSRSAAVRAAPAARGAGSAEHNLYAAVSPVGRSAAPRAPALVAGPARSGRGSPSSTSPATALRLDDPARRTARGPARRAARRTLRVHLHHRDRRAARPDRGADQMGARAAQAAAVASLRARNVAVIASWDDKSRPLSSPPWSTPR